MSKKTWDQAGVTQTQREEKEGEQRETQARNEVPAGEGSALSAQAYSVNSKVPVSMNSFMAHIKNENFSVILMIFLILA